MFVDKDMVKSLGKVFVRGRVRKLDEMENNIIWEGGGEVRKREVLILPKLEEGYLQYYIWFRLRSVTET
jgi:hypothetical protein